MKSIYILFSVFVLSLVSTAHAQEKTCEDVTIKNCPELFVDSCRNDIEFQKKNGYVCLKVLNNSAQNQAFCAGVDMAPCQSENPDCRSIQNEEERRKCCSSIQDDRERVRCGAGFPKCAGNMPELEKRSNDLAEAADALLKSYGGVLKLDPDNVGDVEMLCGKTFDSLNAYHSQAKLPNPLLKQLLGQTKDIASCAKKIKGWVENKKTATNNSKLTDGLSSVAKSKIETLEPIMIELKSVVSQLQEAEPKLYQLLEFHALFCPNQDDSAISKQH